MKTNSRFLFTVAFAAITLTFSACEDTDGKSSKDTKSFVYEDQTYKTVKIGKQVWMAENLNIEIGKSVCYGKKSENCKKCGRLYDWETAMKACPAGWHLPTDMEWLNLEEVIGDSSTAGTALKSKSDWDGKISGIDKYGFSALPCGAYVMEIGNGLGSATAFWSATEKDAKDAWSRTLLSDSFLIQWGDDAKMATKKANALLRDPKIKKSFFSVRCVKD
jgi:uncharacterized protein (TIGR02145 family)